MTENNKDLDSLGISILEIDVQKELFRRRQENLTDQALLLAKARIILELIEKKKEMNNGTSKKY